MRSLPALSVGFPNLLGNGKQQGCWKLIKETHNTVGETTVKNLVVLAIAATMFSASAGSAEAGLFSFLFGRKCKSKVVKVDKCKETAKKHAKKSDCKNAGGSLSKSAADAKEAAPVAPKAPKKKAPYEEKVPTPNKKPAPKASAKPAAPKSAAKPAAPAAPKAAEKK